MFNDAGPMQAKAMRHLLALLFIALLASCTPVPDDDGGRERCGLLEGAECRRSVPGDLPPGDTEIGKLAEQCTKPRYCGPVGYVDCGSAADGPAYYFERRSGKVLGYCGGYCMMGGEKCARTCPPPEWTCQH